MTPIAATFMPEGKRCWIVGFLPDTSDLPLAYVVFDTGVVTIKALNNLKVDVELFERTYAAAQK